MRELTALEIERFDFTGLVPDMNMPALRNSAAAPAKKSHRKHSFIAKHPHKKRRPQIGVARTV